MEEGPTVEDRLRSELAAAAEDIPGASVDQFRQASILSDRSITTAKTSFSLEEIADLDPDTIVFVMPGLASAADELAKLLVPTDPRARSAVRREILTPRTKHNKLYNNCVNVIRVHKGNFGSTEYVQPSIVLRTLLGVQSMRDVPQGPWRPDSVIYKINLSTMLRNVLILQGDDGPNDEASLDLLSDLDVNFGSAIAGPVFDDQAFRLCLSLLRQLCIARVAMGSDEATFDPRTMVESTFYAGDQDGVLVFKHRNVLHMLNLSPELMADCDMMIQNSASEFIDIFAQASQDDLGDILDHFRAEYPWPQFADQVVEYYLARKQILEEQIAAVGGVEQIKSVLEEEVERRGHAKAAEGIRASFSRPGGTPKKRFGMGGIKALKAREKELAANIAASTAAAALAAAPSTAPVAQMTDPALVQQAQAIHDDWQQINDDGQEAAQGPALNAAPSKSSLIPALTAVQAAQRQNAAKDKGKGRSLIDRQEGAQRVPWDDFGSQVAEYAVPPTFQHPASSGQGPYYQNPRRPSNKRPHAAVAEDDMGEEPPAPFDPTQDEGFENDTRDTTAADERRRQAPQPRPQAHLSPRPSGSANPPPPGSAQPSPRPIKVQRRNPGSSIPPAPRPFDPDADFVELPASERFQRAKIASRHTAITASQHKPAQVRTPWSLEEENALIDIIERHGDQGISYATLKRFDTDNLGGRLARRSAEDLRFKARNMKVTFLRYVVVPCLFLDDP